MKHILLKNPLPERMKDPAKVQKFFKTFGNGDRVIMPAYGDNIRTAHHCLKLLDELFNTSPSAIACRKWILNMGIGGETGSVEVVRNGKPGRVGVSETTDTTEFDNWYESLGLSWMDFSRLSCELERNYMPSGNHYLRITLSETNGEWKCAFKLESFLTTAPISRTNNNSTRYIATVDNWDYEADKMVGITRASEIGKPFDWSERNGVFETIVHFKNKDSWSYYGESDLLGIINQMYAECQKGEQAAKIERVATVAKYLLETPEELIELDDCGGDECQACQGKGCETTAVNNREQSMADGMRDLSTNEGDTPHDIVIDFYGKDSGPSTLHKFDVLRDSKWLRESSDELRDIIHSAGFNIPPELTKRKKMNSGFNNEQYLILLLGTDEETIQPMRTRWHNYWSFVIGEIARKTGREDMAEFGIRFENKIQNLIDKIKELKHGTAKSQ